MLLLFLESCGCSVLCVTANSICKPVGLFDELINTGKIQTNDNYINIGYVINQTTVVALKERNGTVEGNRTSVMFEYDTLVS